MDRPEAGDPGKATGLVKPFILLYDRDARILWFSHSEPGVDPLLVVGKHAWEWCRYADDAEQMKTAFARAVVLGESCQYSVRIMAGDREVTHWVHLTGVASGPIGAVSISSAVPEGITRLTSRELEILRHLASGGSPKSFCKVSGMARSTCGTHVGKIERKLGLIGMDQVVAFAARHFV